MSEKKWEDGDITMLKLITDQNENSVWNGTLILNGWEVMSAPKEKHTSQQMKSHVYFYYDGVLRNYKNHKSLDIQNSETQHDQNQS